MKFLQPWRLSGIVSGMPRRNASVRGTFLETLMREVTERDFRMPEFRDAKIEDYEFRADGKIVRKDRWERGVQTIRSIVGIDGREFEIDEVIAAVRKLVEDQAGWIDVDADTDREDLPRPGELVFIEVEDGSRLAKACLEKDWKTWVWSGRLVEQAILRWKAIG